MRCPHTARPCPPRARGNPGPGPGRREAPGHRGSTCGVPPPGPRPIDADSPTPGCERRGAWLRVRARGPGRPGGGRARARDRYGAAPRPTSASPPAAHSLTFFGSGFAVRRACSFSTTWSADSAAIAVTGAASSPELGSRRVLGPQLRPPCIPGGDGSATGPFRASAGWGSAGRGARGPGGCRPRPQVGGPGPQCRSAAARTERGPLGPGALAARWPLRGLLALGVRSQSLEDLSGVYGSQDGIRPQRQILAL